MKVLKVCNHLRTVTVRGLWRATQCSSEPRREVRDTARLLILTSSSSSPRETPCAATTREASCCRAPHRVTLATAVRSYSPCRLTSSPASVTPQVEGRRESDAGEIRRFTSGMLVVPYPNGILLHITHCCKSDEPLTLAPWFTRDINTHQPLTGTRPFRTPSSARLKTVLSPGPRQHLLPLSERNRTSLFRRLFSIYWKRLRNSASQTCNFIIMYAMEKMCLF